MNARGLFLSAFMMLAGCMTPQTGPPLDRYGGPAMTDPPNFDRAAVDVIRGSFAPGRQPDGNTVIFSSADGLIVFDTGRHAAHTQKIVDRATARGQPITAIINSHWHLDHVSGNIPLRKLWPGAAVYSNDAALSEALGSFLRRGLESNRKMLVDPAIQAGMAEDLRADIATVEQGDRLHPTISITAPLTLSLGGRTLDLHTAAAASAGDIWIYDPARRLIASGDIITLPAPFLDTACPSAWRAALAGMLAMPFERLIPGHGREMTRTDVQLYRDAFNALIDCASGGATVKACADAWAVSIASLLDEPSGDAGQAAAYAGYYVESILRPRAFRADCAS